MKKLKYKIKTMFRWIKNWLFCLKYPFWKARNVWSDKPCGYDFTLYEEIPYGWRKAFGKQLSKDLKKALIKDKQLKAFRFSQIKEKWGALCLYNFGAGKETDKIIKKYELMSLCYCINCGKPVRYITGGWISYLCENCVKNSNYKTRRLNSKDIPNKNGGVSYGIDFYEKWDIQRKN